MKRILVLLASLALIATPAAAMAQEERTVVTTIIGYSPAGGDRGTLVTPSTGKADVVAAYRAKVGASAGCYGDQCVPTRPALLQIKRGGTWTNWFKRSLGSWDSYYRDFTSKKPRLVAIRTFLPRYEGLPAIVSSETRVQFLPPTSVRVSGDLVVKPSASASGIWQFRPRSGSITVRVTPASAGRLLQVRDAGEDGYPLIAEARTDARGVATVEVDLTDKRSIEVAVKPTRARAGWQILPDAIS